MTTPVRFWVDPICPWCWVTSRWVRSIAASDDSSDREIRRRMDEGLALVGADVGERP